MEWEHFKEHPDEIGFYPVLYCFDPMEGVFNCASYWDGVKWDRTNIVCFGVKCKNKEIADDLAEKHNPEN